MNPEIIEKHNAPSHYGEGVVSFDAKAELKNIRTMSEDEKNLSKPERLKLRRERLEDIKKKLADQMMGIAEVNAEFENMTFSDEGFDSEKMNAYLEKSAADHKLAPWQIEEYRTAIEKVIERKSIIDSFFTEHCEGKSGEEIFEYIFQKKPYGKVSFKKGSLCPIILCDEEDFVLIRSLNAVEKIDSENNGNLEDERLRSAAGVTLMFSPDVFPEFTVFGSTLVLVKESENSKEDMDGTIMHEEKHALDLLVFPNERKIIQGEVLACVAKLEADMAHVSDEELNNLSPEKCIERFAIEPIKIQLDAIRKISEETAKKEILAFYKVGSDPGLIHSLLASSYEGKGYGIIDEMVIKEYENQLALFSGYEEERTLASELFRKLHKREEKDYAKHLSGGINAMRDLERIGFSKGELIELFETEPLANWEKVFERIKKGNKYKNKVEAYNLTANIKRLESLIRYSEKTIPEIERQLENPSERDPRYTYWHAFRKEKFERYEDALRFDLEEEKKKLTESLNKKREIEQKLAELEKEKDVPEKNV